jgi:hypothetical protein
VTGGLRASSSTGETELSDGGGELGVEAVLVEAAREVGVPAGEALRGFAAGRREGVLGPVLEDPLEGTRGYPRLHREGLGGARALVPRRRHEHLALGALE